MFNLILAMNTELSTTIKPLDMSCSKSVLNMSNIYFSIKSCSNFVIVIHTLSCIYAINIMDVQSIERTSE